MKTAVLAVGSVVLASLWVVSAWADCHRVKKSYPEGAIVCQAGSEFQCGAQGVWKKLPSRCPVEPQAGKDSPADAAKQTEQHPAPQQPSGS